MIGQLWMWIVGIIAIIIGAFIWEDSRDWIFEAFAYLISFEWLGDVWEFFTGMFEDMGDFSVGGLIFGVCSAGLIFLLRKWMLNPFLSHMKPVGAIVWGGATYIACAVVGYLIGKKLFED